MSKLRILRSGITLSCWQVHPHVPLLELAKALDAAIDALVSQGPIAIWVETDNVLYFIGSWR